MLEINLDSLSLSAILFICTLWLKTQNQKEKKKIKTKLQLKNKKHNKTKQIKQNPNTRRIFISSVGVVKILLLGYTSQDWSLQLSAIISVDILWSPQKFNRNMNFSVHYVTHWAAVRFKTGSILINSHVLSIPIIS